MTIAKDLKFVFTGDDAGLQRTFERAQASARKMSQTVGQTNAAQIGSYGKVRADLGKTEASVGHLGKSYERLHHTIKDVIGVTGLAGVAFGLKDVTEEALNSQSAQAKLAKTLDAAGISWKAHGKAIDENLDKMRDASGFAKGELSAAMAGLVRTTGSVSGAQKDLGVVMDVARGKSISLAAAQGIVSKAALGNVRGLKSLQIAVTPVTTAQDKLKASIASVNLEIKNSSGATKVALEAGKAQLQLTAKQAKAQDAQATSTKALAIVTKDFHGQAQAYAKGTQGQFDRARESIHGIEESIGVALLPVLSSAAKEVSTLAKGFEAHWPEIRKDISATVGPMVHFGEGVASFVGHHKTLEEMAIGFAGIAASVKVIGKVGDLTGVTKLLGLGAKSAGALTGGGLLGKTVGRLEPIPVYIVNSPHGGLPGGGPVKTVEQDVENAAKKGAAGGLAARVLGTTAGKAGVFGLGLWAGIATGKLIPGYDPGSTHQQTSMGPSYTPPPTPPPVHPLTMTSIRVGSYDGYASAGKALADYQQKIMVVTSLQQDLAAAEERAEKRGTAAINRLRDSHDHSLTAIRSNLAKTLTTIKGLPPGTESATSLMGKAFASAAGQVRDAMSSADKATRDGARKMQAELQSALSHYGLTGSQASALVRNGTLQSSAARTPGSGLAPTAGAAGGGYIGARGEAGRDTVPVMLGRGEAVLNRHQQAVVEPALRAAYGTGLGGLFAKVKRPHFMASGGIVGNVGAMVREATRIDAHHYPYLWGGGHDASFTPPYDCSGAVSDVLHAGGVLNAPRVSGGFMNYGQPGPGEVTIYANPTHTYMSIAGRWFGTSGQNPGGGAGFFHGAPRAGFAVRHVPVGAMSLPGVSFPSGLGDMSVLGRGEMKVLRRAGDHALRAALSSSFGGATGGGDVPEPAGAYSFDQLKRLWVAAGGPAGAADIMAHVALAESSGQPNARNSIGATGLWQIYNGPGTPVSLEDPMANARAAVAKYQASGLAPWVSSRSVWGQYVAGHTMGGFVGGDGGSIGDIGLYGYGSSGVAATINKITAGLPAANGPKAKAAPKAPVSTSDLNPLTKKVETHTSSQWHQIRLNARVLAQKVRDTKAATKAKAQAAATAQGLVLARADVANAKAALSPGVADDIAVAQHGLQKSHHQLADIDKQLRNPGLRPADELALLQKEATLLQDVKTYSDTITGLRQQAADNKQSLATSTSDTEFAEAALTPGTADDVAANQHALAAAQKSLVGVRKQLKGKHLAVADRAGLMAQQAALLGNIKTYQDAISSAPVAAAQDALANIDALVQSGQLSPQDAVAQRQAAIDQANNGGRITASGGPLAPADMAALSGTGQASDYNSIQTAVSDVDLHVQAGDLTQAQADQQKAGIYADAVAGRYGPLAPHDLLNVRAQQGQAGRDTAAAQQGMIDVISELNNHMATMNAYTANVNQVDALAIHRGLGAIVSGQMASRINQRGLTPGAGSIARY